MAGPAELQGLLTRIRRMLPALLPAYTREEEGHDAEEYAAFYRSHVEHAIAASAAFREAIEAYARSPDSPNAATRLLAARRSFIESLPFCRDELDPSGDDSYVPLMLRGYQSADGTFWSAWCHLEYEEVLAEMTRAGNAEC